MSGWGWEAEGLLKGLLEAKPWCNEAAWVSNLVDLERGLQCNFMPV